MQKNLSILLTNTRSPTEKDISFWQRRGYAFVYHQSLLNVEFLPVHPLNINPQAIVLTSGNAALALEKANWHRDIPVYTVGKSTNFFAKAAGFTNCFTPSDAPYPSATELIEWLKKNLEFKNGPIIFGCGNTIRHDVAESLSACGFETKKIVLYNTHPILNFDEKVMSLFKNKAIRAVVLNSEQALSTFAGLCTINAIASHELQIIVPSKFIKEKAQELGFLKATILKRDYL